MKTRYLLLTVLGMLFLQTAISQNSTDAYRYSSYDILGSARFVALSGAYGAIGGDLSTLNYNPAGLGIFQKGEMSFSPAINYSDNATTYNGTVGTDSKSNLNLGMFGMVNTERFRENSKAKSSGWKALNYGFSLSRIKNYNNSLFINGGSYNSSLANVWRDMANGYFPEDLNEFNTGLAWDAYVLDTVSGNPTQYLSSAPASGIYQSYWENAKGYVNELSFAISANYNDKLILGFSLGIPTLHYSSVIEYSESALGTPEAYESANFTYTQYLLTEGTGINAKFGFIYILSPNIRFSGAIHTPTYYGVLTDNYTTTLSNTLGDGYTYEGSSSDGVFNYALSTPACAMAGVSIFLNKNGFISVDYEYMDYSKSKLSSTDYAYTYENSDIRANYQVAHALRIGAEWRLSNLFIRGGYNVMGSPMKTDINNIISSGYSLGFGYRLGTSYYFDFAYAKRTTDNLYYIYDPSYVNPANVTNTTNNYIFTLGYKF